MYRLYGLRRMVNNNIIYVGNSGGCGCTTTKRHCITPTEGCECPTCKKNRINWKEGEYDSNDVFIRVTK